MSLKVRRWLVALSVLGVFIAAYLSWVKLSSTEAFCGGVGDCSSVQNSPYGYVLGIPVAYPGLLAYILLLGLALYNLRAPAAKRTWTELAFFAVAFGGLVFSAYLTYTELFLIRAICPWCVASFINLIVITALSGVAQFGRVAEAEP